MKKMKITRKQLQRIIKEAESSDRVHSIDPLTGGDTEKQFKGSLSDVEQASNRIEEILNDLYDRGVENDGLKALLNNIIRDIDRGFVGEPS